LVAGCSLNGQADFRVEPERPVVQVCRADEEQPVVDDDHLGMDGDRHVARRKGGKRPEPAVAIHCLQAVDQVVAGVVHQQAVHRATAPGGTDDDHLGPTRLG